MTKSYLQDQVLAKSERVLELAAGVGHPRGLNVEIGPETSSWNKGWGKYGK